MANAELNDAMTKTDIRSFFNFDPVGRRIEELETPVPIIDIGVVDRNLKKWQSRCDAAKIGNRPHIKTHKMAGLAKYQLAVGAAGITVQKLGEAEVMADAGITDMLLTLRSIVGKSKLARLAKLARDRAVRHRRPRSGPIPGPRIRSPASTGCAGRTHMASSPAS